MATDPMANNNYLAVPQTGEKNATTLATYGADDNANETAQDTTKGAGLSASTAGVDRSGSNAMQDMTGPC